MPNKITTKSQHQRETKDIPNDWDYKKIIDVAIVNQHSLGSRTPEDYEFYYYDLSAIENGKITKPNEKIKFKDAPSRARRKFKENDILMSTVRPYLQGYGHIDYEVKDSICSTGYAVITCKDESDSRFLYYNLFSDFTSYQIQRLLVGSNYPAINNKEVENLKVPFPKRLEEREKISSILSLWDKAIRLKENLIEQKKKQYQGLMQRLLTGKNKLADIELDNKDEVEKRVRLIENDEIPKGYIKTKLGIIPQTWSIKKLEEIVSPVIREVPKPEQGYWRLGLRSHAKGTFHEFIEDPSEVSMDKLFIVKENDLVVNITFAWEHAIALANKQDQDKLVSHRFPTYEFKEDVLPLFYKYYVIQPHFRHMLENISPGGAGRNRVMSKKDFLKLDVIVPPYKEQVYIAKVLSTSEKELNLLENEIDELKKQKKSLMQSLLTGKVRVKE